jgi:hypothetical protein
LQPRKQVSVKLWALVVLWPLTNAREKTMADKIKTGTILVQEGVLLPDSVRFESEPYSKGWRLVKALDGYGKSGIFRLLSEC